VIVEILFWLLLLLFIASHRRGNVCCDNSEGYREVFFVVVASMFVDGVVSWV